MRGWLPLNIWSQSWVMVRADTTYEDSYMPTVVISPSVSSRVTGSNAGVYLSCTLNDGLCITVAYSVSLEIQIIIPGVLSKAWGLLRLCVWTSCWMWYRGQVCCETDPRTWLSTKVFRLLKSTPSLPHYHFSLRSWEYWPFFLKASIFFLF